MHRIILAQSPNAIALLDRNLCFLITTKQWVREYSLTEVSLEGRPFYEFFEESAELDALLRDALRGISATIANLSIKKTDGTTLSVRGDVRPWYAEDGTIGGVLLFTVEIGAEKELAERLQIEQDQFRGAFETSAIGMAIVGLDGTFKHVNRSVLKLFGYSKSEFRQLSFQDVTHPDDLQSDLESLNELVAGRRDFYQMEKRYLHKTGQVIWALLSVSVVRDTKGKPIHFISQIMDITETKNVERMRIIEMDKNNNRLAYQLHENVAQTLAGLKLFLHSRRPDIAAGDDIVDSSLDNLIREVTQLSESIMPTTFLQDDLHFHLSAMINKYVSDFLIGIHSHIDEELKNITFNAGYHLYRIVEDFLKLTVINQVKSIALTVEVYASITVEFTVLDNSRNSYPAQNSVITNDIKTRIEILKGSVVEPSAFPGYGSLKLAIPLRELIH